jgi:hypothetical protein
MADLCERDVCPVALLAQRFVYYPCCILALWSSPRMDIIITGREKACNCFHEPRMHAHGLPVSLRPHDEDHSRRPASRN